MVRAPCNFDWIYPTSSAKGVKSKCLKMACGGRVMMLHLFDIFITTKKHFWCG